MAMRNTPKNTPESSGAQNKTRSRSKEPEIQPEPQIPEDKIIESDSFIQKTLIFLKSEEFRKISALILMGMGIFIFFSQISHFISGIADADLAENGPSGDGHIRASNWLGTLGAWTAYLLISDGLGFISILIPVLTFITGYSLLDSGLKNLAYFLFKYSLFLLPWTSLCGALIARIFNLSSPDWGGAIGLWMVDSMAMVIGSPGVIIVALITLLGFLVLLYNIDLRPGTWLSGAGIELKPEDLLEQTEHTPSAQSESTTPPVSTTVPSEKKSDHTAVPEEEEEEEESEEEITFILEPAPAETSAAIVPPIKPGNEINFEISKPDPDTKPLKSAEIEFTFEKPSEPSNEEISEPGLLDGHENIIVTEDNRLEKLISEQDLDKSHEMDTVVDWSLYDPTLELRNYKYPTIDLLNHQPVINSPELEKQELVANKEKIETTLRNYGIEIVSIKATIGPTVTLYEIVPAPGIKISKIRNLEDDIALSLAALGIRIIAPIPGKGTIGIEIPNSHPEMVTFRSVIGTEKFRDSKAELPIAIGKTITNEVFIADLTKMPHLLIAGATGQGKSVGLNNIIASILYKRHPSQVKFVLIDPKKVEMPLYQPIESHFLAKLPNYEDAIITDSKQVIHVLNSLCMEMDARYDLLKMAHTRNLTEYNKKFMERRLNPLRGHKFLPYIVLVIDELADLMMTAGKEVETPIARLAQLARAVGIHLVVATQRPSVNVITGIIKANFPTRMSYKVSSKIDSRTILDQGGADQLIGRGDLLLSTGSEVIRIQNAFIDTPEVEKLVAFISDQTGYPEPYYLPEVQDESDKDEEDEYDTGERDRMFADAARMVVRHQQGSTSLIQRRLKLGYNRAGRIMDQLERAGIVGPANGSKPRDVLVHTEADLEQFLNRHH